ncbi:MAG: flagellar hook basal-body protein, partial [Hyphomonadaceae bacterium]|nr:flagellar hook basal-body protein [Hyphomonadaceae bacterium]
MDIGAVALRAQQRALDTIANNVANVNTPTYKRVDSSFSEVMGRQIQPASQTALLASRELLPAGGVRFSPQEMLFEQGELRVTGNRLDLAVDGAGFIELLGPDGQLLLWRGGRLQMLDDGLLASDSGHALRANISVPDDATNLTITAEGVVKADLPALLQRLAAVRGRLSLCADQAAAAKWWLSMPMASVSAEGPMP